MSPKKILLLEILTMLQDSPNDWDFGNHRTKHKHLPIEIWTSNRYYGTEWRYGAIQGGGNSILWFLFPSEWWRVRLIAMVERAQFKQLKNHNLDGI